MTTGGQPCFRDKYVLGKSIGSGNFSVVRQCRLKSSRTLHAAKCMELKGDTEDILDMVRGEVSMMQKLSPHALMLTFLDVFYEPTRVIIVTELSEHGDLYERVMENPRGIEEAEARLYGGQVASAVAYLHSLRVVHRDIKPENLLLFTTDAITFSVKLCDFGLAEEVPLYGGLTRVCGTPSYVAPEVLERKTYGLQVDVWSMGVLFYFLLSQFCPFEHAELNSLFELIKTAEVQFTSPKWNFVTDTGKDLLRAMLNRNPKSRLNAQQMVDHPWFRDKAYSCDAMSRGNHRTLKSVGIAVMTANTLLRQTSTKANRENAVLTLKILERSSQTYALESEPVKCTTSRTCCVL